jgi:hypothetical protein
VGKLARAIPGLLSLAGIVAVVACGGHRPGPDPVAALATSTPSPQGPRVTIVYLHGVALANCATVLSLDGIQSDDHDLWPQWTWHVEFGDGNTTTAVPSGDNTAYLHVYTHAGTMTASMSVADQTGQTDSHVTFQVATLTGTWVSSFHNTAAGRDETRVLTLVQHEDGTISGTYRHPEGNTDALSGEVCGDMSGHSAGERPVDLRASGIHFSSPPSSYFGPFGADESVTSLLLYVEGGSADKQSLTFKKQ